MTDAIILAAGNSKRFGKDNKLFTDFNSTLLITHVVSEICKSKLRNIIVITGKDHVKINKLLKEFRVQVIKNLRFNEGINSSISLGIKKLPRNSLSTMICLADMPLLKSEDYNSMVQFEEKFRNKSKIIVPYNKTTRGNPVIFGKDYFNTLVNLVGDHGGKKILEKNRDVIYYNTNSEGFYFDVDTQKDLTKLKNN